MALTPILAFPKFRAFSQAGLPLSGGKVYTYQAGTTTPKATYSDSAGASPNANPVVLDANGEAVIRLTAQQGYKIVLKDASDVTQWTMDDVYGDYITAEYIGQLIFPLTSYETSASVTPSDYSKPYDDARRYGHVADGTTDHTPILNKIIAISVAGGPTFYKFQRGTHKFNSRPDDITGPLVISGQGMNNTYFVRNYTCATADIGLFNFRATSTSSHVQDATLVSGLSKTGGSLISAVQPSSGDGADWSPLAIRCRLTGDTALGGAGDSHAYGLYVDGTARTSPLGQRSTLIEDCVLFGGASGAAYISGVVNFNWNNTSTYISGGTSGKVVITGTASVPSSYVNIRGANIYGFSLDRVEYLNVQVSEINGDITNTVNTKYVVINATQSSGTRDSAWVDSVFIDATNGILREKAGGNAVAARYNSSNPRAGVYIGGTSGVAFMGGNLTWSSGNTFNFDKTKMAWYVGDPGDNGRLSIGCATGTAGNDASVTGTSDAVRITTDGNIYPGRTPSTSMTNGFFYIPSGAGIPSGTPTAITGFMPMYYDTTNNKFYVYNGAWKSVALT